MSNEEKIQMFEKEKEALAKKLDRMNRKIAGLPEKIENAPEKQEMKDEDDKTYYLNMKVIKTKSLRKTKIKRINTIVAIKRTEEKLKALQG